MLYKHKDLSSNPQHPWEDLVITGMCLFGVEMLAIGITLDSVRDPIPKDRERQSRTLTSSFGHHEHTHRYTHRYNTKAQFLVTCFNLWYHTQVFSKALDFVFSDYSCSTYVLASFSNLAQAGEEESSSEKMPQDQAIGKPVVLFLSD